VPKHSPIVPVFEVGYAQFRMIQMVDKWNCSRVKGKEHTHRHTRYVYMYIYIYTCVCVKKCVWLWHGTIYSKRLLFAEPWHRRTIGSLFPLLPFTLAWSFANTCSYYPKIIVGCSSQHWNCVWHKAPASSTSQTGHGQLMATTVPIWDLQGRHLACNSQEVTPMTVMSMAEECKEYPRSIQHGNGKSTFLIQTSICRGFSSKPRLISGGYIS